MSVNSVTSTKFFFGGRLRQKQGLDVLRGLIKQIRRTKLFQLSYLYANGRRGHLDVLAVLGDPFWVFAASFAFGLVCFSSLESLNHTQKKNYNPVRMLEENDDGSVNVLSRT